LLIFALNFIHLRLQDIISKYTTGEKFRQFQAGINTHKHLAVSKLGESALSFVFSSLHKELEKPLLLIFNDLTKALILQ